MTVLNLTLVAEALKSFYLEGLQYQLNDKASVLLAQMEKTSEDVQGKEIVMALRYGRVGGIGNRADDGTLPTPNSRKTKQAKWETKNIFSRFQITDKTIEASKTSRGAFASMLKQEIQDCETDAKLDLSRQVLGDGVGTLCTLTANGSHSGGAVTYTVDSTMYLAEGMLIDVVKAADGALRHADTGGVEITAVVSETSFIASGTANAGSDTDLVVVAGNYGLELTGVEAVINQDNSLYGIDRNNNLYKWLNSHLKNVNGEISETAIQSQIDEVNRSSGSDVDFLLCSLGVRRAYQNLQSAMKSHVNTLELKGGFSALSYSGGNKPIAVVADKYVKGGLMYGLDLADWKMYRMADWSWMNRDGNILSRVANKPAYEATLLSYCDIGCQRPKGQFKMYGITEHN